MEFERYWEDFQVSERKFAGTISADKAEIIEFAKKFDPQPFHIDEEKAKSSIYGGIIASGWHSCSLLMRVIYDSYLIDSASLGSPGLEMLKWLGPFRPEEKYAVYRKIEDTRESKSKSDRGIVKTRWSIEDSDGNEILVLIGTNFFLKRSI